MSVFNRRNAVVGWATMTVFKTWLSRRGKADKEAEARERRKKRRLLGALVATGVGFGIWAKTRGGGTPDIE